MLFLPQKEMYLSMVFNYSFLSQRFSANACSDRGQTMLYIFITSVYLVYVVDNGYTFGAKGGYQQGYACTYIGRGHIVCSEPKFSVVSDDDCTVRVAKYYLCTHIDEFVHEKESALEHFLVYQDTAFGLCGDYEHYTEQVGRKPGPRSVGYGHYGTVHKRLYSVAFLLGDEYGVATLLYVYAQTPETIGNDAEFVVCHIFYQ